MKQSNKQAEKGRFMKISQIGPAKKSSKKNNVIILLFYTLTSCIGNSHDYRYKMIVKIEKKGETFSGSSVREVRISSNLGGPFSPMAGKPYRARVVGEAVLTDLGASGTAFTLLRRAEPDEGLIYDQGCTGDAVTDYIMLKVNPHADCSTNPIDAVNKLAKSGVAIPFEGPTAPTTVVFKNPKDKNSLSSELQLIKTLSFLAISRTSIP